MGPAAGHASAVRLVVSGIVRFRGFDLGGGSHGGQIDRFVFLKDADQLPVFRLRLGPALDDLDLIDMHEAFAAQILSNIQAFASDSFARERLGRDKAIGEIDDAKFNIYGGSISLGHPFGATGARQIMTMANELDRRGGGTALVTQCAAGGLGAAVILEK